MIAWNLPDPLKLQPIKIVAEYTADLDSPEEISIRLIAIEKKELTRIRLTFTADDMNTDDWKVHTSKRVCKRKGSHS